jgi:catechol 2,3-dioxygenase-like lactoylglutathione lyase family enzyme
MTSVVKVIGMIPPSSSFFPRPQRAPGRTYSANGSLARPLEVVSSLAVKLDHVVICVSDFTRANAFYRDVLGAQILEIDGRVAYRLGEQQLNVHGPGVRPAMVARVPVVPGNSDLCFEWTGPIAEAVEHLRGHGVPIEAGPMARGGAKGRGTSVYFRDPDGSLLELISYAAPGLR